MLFRSSGASSDKGDVTLDWSSRDVPTAFSQSVSLSSRIASWLFGRGSRGGRCSTRESMIESRDARPGPGDTPLRIIVGAVKLRNEEAEGRLLWVGAKYGDPGSSVSGVVGLEESWPLSLNTRSKIEDVLLVVDCGELGPEDAHMLW